MRLQIPNQAGEWLIIEQPVWAALPKGTPEKVRDLLKRCLNKDPDRRLHDIADARIELEDLPGLLADRKR